MMTGWAKATNPDTGDKILVAFNPVEWQCEYSINGAPSQALPADYSQCHETDILAVAHELLALHIAACQVSDIEELTLP